MMDTMMDQTVTIPFDDDDSPPPEHREGWLLVRIHVPELNVSKCLQFPTERLVWDVKQQVLASLPKDLKESFNYGLFCPPSNGKAGKFLDEERRLGDYPFSGPVGYLELKYKRRVYKMLNLDEKQLKALHTRANLRRFLEYVNNGQVEKVSKMCTKGLDPNFHCQETNETPLTIAVGVKKPNKLLIALVNGGAILDYRAKDGSTALHRAVEKNSLESVSTLLELGASPNYRDVRGITPLYLSVTKKADPKISEGLLHDHASLGIQDSQGWQEIHQACRNGLVHHLEHLLFYSADMNGRNASGNTPLHVCAVNNQEACARMLLFRGAQRGSLNYANQTPYQVAVIAGNLELAEIIQNYKPEDIVPFRGPPRYNPRRRSALGWPSVGSHCGGALGGMGGHMITSSATMIDLRTLTRLGMVGPPSPCPSEQPFSSASSSLSEGSSHRSHEDDISIVTDKSLGDTSDIISDSSGVGTASSDSTACSIGHPNMTVVCMIPYSKNYPGHLNIQPGDVIEVFGSTDCGLLEGQVRGSNRTGLFPIQYVQEVNFRQKNITNVSTAPSHLMHQQQQQHHQQSLHLQQQMQQQQHYMDEMMGGGQMESKQSDYNVLNNNNNSNGNSASNNNMINSSFHNNNHNGGGGGQQYSSLTAPRIKKMNFNEPRSVTLHRAKRGFGFVLRGAKATSPLMQLKPSDRCPALQYLDDVDPGGVADLAGLKPGDYLLAINNEDVRAASHEQVVDLIRKSGALVSLTVMSAPNYGPGDANGNLVYQMTGNGNGGYAAPAASQFATLPRRIMQNGKMPAPAPPQRDPKTTLSVGRARAKSMVAGLECDDRDENDVSTTTKSSSAESIHNQSQSNTPQNGGTPVQLRTASIKARPTSSRITAAELEEMFQRQQGAAAADRYSSMMTTSNFRTGGDSGSVTPHASPQKAPLVYSSVADMKRKKAKGGTGTLRGKPCEIPTVNGESAMRRTFHSTPDLTLAMAQNGGWNQTFKNHSSQDDMNRYRGSMQRLNLPPPNHPPPPAPTQQGHLVKVDVSSEYECTSTLQKMRKNPASTEIMSSFKPSSNAKLYASPQDIRSVAFRAKMDKTRRKTTQVTSLSGISDYAQPSAVIGSGQQHKEATAAGGYRATMPTAAATPVMHNDRANIPPPPPPDMSNVPMPPPPPPPEQPAPPIPEPDYSLSESEDAEEDKKSINNNNNSVAKAQPVNNPIYKSTNGLAKNDAPTSIAAAAAALNKVSEKKQATAAAATTEQSGANGGGSNSMLHSFSVSEIQKIRNNLKSSKSYPHDLKERVEEEDENEKEKEAEQEQPKEHLRQQQQQRQEAKSENASVAVPSTTAAKVTKPTAVSNSHSEVSTTTAPAFLEQRMLESSQLINPLAKKSVNFAMDTKPAAVKTSSVSEYSTVPMKQTVAADSLAMAPKREEIRSSPQPVRMVNLHSTMDRQMGTHQYNSAPIYVKKEDRTVASIMGDEDDEIGLDELDDECLNAADSPSPPPMEFQRHNSMTRKQATSLAMQRSMQIQQKASPVSLTQLPPPLENCIVESDLEVLANSSAGLKQMQANSVKAHYHVHAHIAHSQAVHAAGGGHYTNRQHNNPIQVQFHAAGGGQGGLGQGMAVRGGPATSPSTEHLVLAPPPQFSDGVVVESVGMAHGHQHHQQHQHIGHYHGVQAMQQQQQQQQQLQQQPKNVRIVGAVPKSLNRF